MLRWLGADLDLAAERLQETPLYQRVRAAGRWVLGSLALLALGELIARPGENPAVSALQVLTAVGVAIALAAVARATNVARLLGIALVTEMWCALGSAAIAIATAHSSTSLIVLVALTAGAAAVVPWGARPQAVVAVWNSLMFPFEIVASGHPLFESSRELAALLVINFGSIFVARELQRQRHLTRIEQRQRLERERELERQRAFLYQVIDINPHLVFAKDRAGRFTLVNQAVAALYGTRVEALIGRTDADFNADPAEVEHFRREDLAVIESGRERVIPEERITDASGQQRWLRTIKRPLASDGAATDQVLGVATDITDQKAAAALLEETAAVAAALAKVGEGIIAGLNRDDLLQRLCALTQDVLAADSAQVWLLDRDRAAYVPTCRSGDRQEAWEAVRLLTAPAASVEEHRAAAEREEAIWIPAGELAMPYRLLASGLRGLLWITLRRGSDTAGVLLASYRDAAEPGARGLRIARGVAQLASMALENARLHDELQRANSLKSEFMATMSHELRTPLNVIIGYGSLLLEGAMGTLHEEQTATLRRMHDNAVQLLELINATLDVSRLESGRIPLDLAPVDVASILADVDARTHDLRAHAGVAFTWDVDDGMEPLVTDPAKLRIVLVNLVGNALKFTTAGQVAVRAAARGDVVEIAVSDTGIGIAPEMQQAIFEPFRQADASIGTRFGGVGLGLYIVHRLVAALGGTIELDSEIGRGSTFRVRLPRRASAIRAA